ncbi:MULTISPECIES: YbaK/EbsC family protein [Sphingobium]|jgi:prolyl-tRNA editing enzyme YbaK/EbsC (Cys-tRNA(Pro) deacylase)|uniref:YbaK/EbsC family protein n=1 Tax=Sphingobium fuliginis (strain ATCC 27551) TaxID=336203 RepID=A0A292ZE52_SPHSA|nr:MULTISPECIES: YbaK/EbsC family protein [Sphingobium]QOT72821.1 YbaK/EbsC family protein [Sphingobium fuliginis]GAY21150.1 tRNA proofreading protein STM4549 [Sphingobium fuliginis]
MSAESVRAFFSVHAPDVAIIDQGVSTATVNEAAEALGVVPARIAKTLSLRVGDEVALVVARGDARLNNGKAKAALGARPRMLGLEEVEGLTGHPVGGVCPFGLTSPLPVYCDISLRDFETVFPAAGSRTTSVELTPERLAELTAARWIDICTIPEDNLAEEN